MNRRPRYMIVLKASIFPYLVVLLPLWGMGVITGHPMITTEMLPWYALEVLLVVAAMIYGFSAILYVYGWLFHRNDPGYRDYIRLGGDPYCDNLPDGFNTGMEPDYGSGRRTTCWNCGGESFEPHYGALDMEGMYCPHCGAHMVTPGSPRSIDR